MEERGGLLFIKYRVLGWEDVKVLELDEDNGHTAMWRYFSCCKACTEKWLNWELCACVCHHNKMHTCGALIKPVDCKLGCTLESPFQGGDRKSLLISSSGKLDPVALTWCTWRKRSVLRHSCQKTGLGSTWDPMSLNWWRGAAPTRGSPSLP
jgi:hypothetical protein